MHRTGAKPYSPSCREQLFSETAFRHFRPLVRGGFMRTVGWSVLRSVLAGLAFIGSLKGGKG
jgi:hypothetical protein